MIFDTIVAILVAVFEGILALLPTMALPAAIMQNASAVGQTAAGLNGVLPVTTLGLCLAVVVAVRLFILLWAVVVWIYERFPFKAT